MLTCLLSVLAAALLQRQGGGAKQVLLPIKAAALQSTCHMPISALELGASVHIQFAHDVAESPLYVP